MRGDQDDQGDEGDEGDQDDQGDEGGSALPKCFNCSSRPPSAADFPRRERRLVNNI